ncbi:hypothetical protein ANCDUO_05324 [Ancylostoma duodenale]|uniref:Rab-GAP TBC domain-containing protein n=1 Tax=Ancylostoma duodenale TaxID=51022 RepID=A0A0C2DNY0_9BILA|nr:hypothetical protein ANCDUO_05324 [Ancylostoma duodenale]
MLRVFGDGIDRLWDVYILEGDPILLAMAINIMKMHEKSIRKLQIENFMDFVQTTLANNFGYSDDETMFSLREVLSRLKSDGLHIPPPPKPEDLPEVPTKALGPILARPISSIREEQEEIKSRRSHAACEWPEFDSAFDEMYEFYYEYYVNRGVDSDSEAATDLATLS